MHWHRQQFVDGQSLLGPCLHKPCHSGPETRVKIHPITYMAALHSTTPAQNKLFFTDAQGCTSSDRSMPYFLQTAWQEWEGVGSVLPIWSHSNCSPRQVQLWLKESCVDEVKEPNEPMAFWQIISPKSWKKVSTMPWTKREESRNTQNHWNHQHPIHSHRPWIPSTEWVAAWWKDFSFSCHLKGPLPYIKHATKSVASWYQISFDCSFLSGIDPSSRGVDSIEEKLIGGASKNWIPKGTQLIYAYINIYIY